MGAVVVTLLALVGVGCESTQDKAAKLAPSDGASLNQKGLVVTKQAKGVDVLRTESLTDENGTAVAVTVRNTTKRRLLDVPISIDVQDARGTSLFRNDAPGLDAPLVSVSVLRPGERMVWVNDQIPVTGKIAKVVARVGEPTRTSTVPEPQLTLEEVSLSDEAGETTASGFVANPSDIDQRNVVVYVVSRDGKRLVAAGRGQVQRVRPGKRARFDAFFIGKPREGSLELAVPPIVPTSSPKEPS